MNNQNHLKNLKEFIDDKISFYKKRVSDTWEVSFSDLDDFEQGEFAYLILQNDRSLISECFVAMSDSLEDDMTGGLLAVLRNNDTESKIDLSETFFKNAIVFLKDNMQALLSTRCNELFADYMNDCGFFKTECQQTGEHEYKRSYI